MSLHLPATSLDLYENGSESASESDGNGVEEVWSDWVSDSANAKQCKSLFEDKLLASAAEALDYDKKTYGFDLNSFCEEKGSQTLPSFVEAPNTTCLQQHSTSMLVSAS